MARILVTGSSGHLGEALMRTLAGRDAEAVGLDAKPSPFTTFVGSVSDRALVDRALDGVTGVIHTAALHKPHVATHGRQDFIDTNATGTLALLEAAEAAGVSGFVFTSTTSAFGAALRPGPGQPAAWIDEDVVPVPRNIYGVTKLAAESLVELFARERRLAAVILRTSRFFPEDDDDRDVRTAFETPNVQSNELLARRADIADMVEAPLLALEAAPRLGFGRYIVSATTPFSRADLPELRRDLPSVVARLYPEQPSLYAARGWRLFEGVDRVYDNARARRDLGWTPNVDFAHVLASLARGDDFRSPLARAVGAKGYHDRVFAEGPYPVA
jgi:UDP-glucose 4-epimerase